MNSTVPKTVLAIDDTAENLTLINGLLKGSYKVKVANNGERGITLAHAEPLPDLILLDVMMPGIDGWEVCRRIKSDIATRDIPIIFLTARIDADDERKGFELGAVDYITKPINPPVLLARVKAQLTVKASADFLRDQNAYLESEVAKRTSEVKHILEASAVALAAIAETRDNDTGNHIRRTQQYVRILADALREHPRFAAALTDAFVADLLRSAPLHDIGKVGIPDRILLKPGKLTNEEFGIMKTHTILGRHAVETAERHLGEHIEFLDITRDIAYSHHERWDGNGYPQGLSGEAIPIAARLMALADVYDALVNIRSYKPAFSHEEAARIIAEERGRHFDPDIADAFIKRQEEFRAISAQFPEAAKQ
jgi:putative two-component system response regulator